MTPELLNKLKHLANIAAHLPHDVTLEDEDAAMKALHGELAADTVLQMIALAERALLAAAPAPIHETIVQKNCEMVCTACGTTAALAGSQVQAAEDAVDAARWRAFRNRDGFKALDFADFADMFRDDADAVIDAAMREQP